MSNIFALEQNRRGRVPHLAVLVWNDPIVKELTNMKDSNRYPLKILIYYHFPQLCSMFLEDGGGGNGGT